MKLFEATIRVNGKEFKDRVGAETAQEAMKLLSRSKLSQSRGVQSSSPVS